MPEPSTSGLPLVATAAELERLTRETLIRLLWLAARRAHEKNQAWIEAADKVTSTLESDVVTDLSKLRRDLLRRERVLQGDTLPAGELATETPSDDGDPDPIDDDTDNPLSDVNHAKRLREMASLLTKVADALEVPAPQD